MKCQRCKSERVMNFMAHCRDCFNASLQGSQYGGYVIPGPWGYGDDFEGDICLDCGQLQGTWPCETPEALLPQEEEE